jgi:hypothetical protein
MELEFEGEVWFWQGPAPHHFVTVPDDEAAELREVAAALTYGWGCLPMRVRIGRTDFSTSLFPKDGGYIVPIKVAVRRAEGIELGDRVTLRLTWDTVTALDQLGRR